MTDDPGTPPDPPAPPPKRRRKPPPSLDGFDTGIPDEPYEASPPTGPIEPAANVIVEAPPTPLTPLTPPTLPTEAPRVTAEATAAPVPITDLPTVPS
nr:hypothetical protein [Deltaproteobacteria bacterium]